MTQDEALAILKTGRNAFLTGAPGSGKTYVINKYVSHLKSHGIEVGVTASTGIAATHLEGVTIHSWSGIGIRDSLNENELEEIAGKSYLKKRILNAQTLIIDEASMLHPVQLDMADKVIRKIKDSEEPFGGIQVILSGDMFQLPPIARGDETPMVNTSRAWQELNPSICYIEEQHRHQEGELMKILNHIRQDSVSNETNQLLQTRLNANLNARNITRLYTHNADVDHVNAKELEKIEGEPESFAMSSTGNTALVKSLKRSCLAPENLFLKKGALVMFVKNNQEKGYVNGTQGKVVDFQKYTRYPIIETLSGQSITAEPETWRIEEDGKIKAEITQIPLRLAWAITVHKSQGMTLEAAEIDLSRSFVPGMGYVALSRIRSLDGLRLIGLNRTALLVNPAVIAMDKEFKELSSIAARNISNMSKDKLSEIQHDFAGVASTESKKPKKGSTLQKTKELLSAGHSIADIAIKRKLTEGTIISHLEKLLKKDDIPDISHIAPPLEDMKRIAEAFKNNPEQKLSTVRAKLGHQYSYEMLRIARLFL